MSNSLVSFLERRKKSAVKASTLLQKTEEQSDEEQVENNQEEEQEVQSEHDNEWKVSSDESDDLHQSTSFGPNLIKIIQTVENGDPDENAKESKEKKTQQIWPKNKESDEEVEEESNKPKIWVPKFKESKNLLNCRNDVGLAESVKMFESKNESGGSKKKKKSKPKSSQDVDDDDDFGFVKVKFDVFSLLDQKYSEFNSGKFTMDEELVKSKYLTRYL